jgi:hypothetical protein
VRGEEGGCVRGGGDGHCGGSDAAG